MPGAGPPRVAFAIGRNVGGAVQRNRIRRRLRSALARGADQLPPGAYLFGADAAALTMDFDRLERCVWELVEAIGAAR